MTSRLNTGSAMPQKIWIDLDNTPHVPFFRPILRELRSRGIPVVVTARDAFQVCELAARLQVPCQRIGQHPGRNKWRKVAGLLLRAGQLAPFAVRERPALAVSHGARAQILAANMLRIPTVMLDDYEHSRHVPLAKPKWVIFPEVLASKGYCAGSRVKTYPGIKEDVYAGDFTPDPTLLETLGVNPERVLVTIRPPATVAHYHSPESDRLFEALMERVGKMASVTGIMLPRNGDQERDLRARYQPLFAGGQLIIPDRVVDGLSLVWYSDLVVSGGGTMNREAAALGVPVYSIFRGPIGAIDKSLQEQGRMVLVETGEDVVRLIRMEKRARANFQPKARPALRVIVEHLAEILTLQSDRVLTATPCSSAAKA